MATQHEHAERYQSTSELSLDLHLTSSDPRDVDICALCNHILNDGQEKKPTVTNKGVAGLHKVSRARGGSRPDFYTGQILHTSCRHDYYNQNSIRRDFNRKEEHWSAAKKTSLRSSTNKFDFANDCLLCGRCTRDLRKKGDVSFYQIRTSSCQANLELLCLQKGPGDKWAETVKGCIEYAQDLCAAGAVAYITSNAI
ncbi:hypothetical protein ElyMa_005830600 [Elysia marginata]|uniref:Uncharacterized protein n=1 Tax=Elysia marginata TaxID=1093978 RepID=A0AAV4FYB5_9GAST|nr:hypothetical protein ElyMa_005830600 [Elysia marginata]